MTHPGRRQPSSLTDLAWLSQALFEPVVGVWLVVEGGHLSVPGATVQRDGLCQRLVRLQADNGDPGLHRMALEVMEQSPSEPEAASPAGHPHPLDLGRGTVMQLQGATADGLLAQSGEEQQAGGRSQLVRISRDAEGRVEAGLEALAQLREVLLEAPPSVGSGGISDGDGDHRSHEQALDLGHGGG